MDQSQLQPWTSHLDLYGTPECDYYAQVTIGSTVMNLVLDTGSSNTAVISDLCTDTKNCSFIEKPFLPSPPEPNNFAIVNASYGNTKHKSSWKGIATGQVISFNGIQQTFARVDQISENHSFFVPRCPKNQGIWGLAHSTLQTYPHHHENSYDKKFTIEQQKLTLFDSIRREKGLPNAFTIQICPKSAVDPGFSRQLAYLNHDVSERHTDYVLNKINSTKDKKKCSREGHLWLGGYSSQSIGNDIVWVPLYQNHYYEVKLESFLLNGKPIPGIGKINSPRTIIDTGTKDIALSSSNLEALLNALWQSRLIQFDSIVTKEHERSFWLDHAQLSIPKDSVKIAQNITLAISFENNNNVSIPIENIINIKPLEQMKDWINISWTGFSNSGGGELASTILGNTFLRGKTVIFDRGKEETNSKSRIGFADAAACCKDYSSSDVDIILSVDSITKGATPIRDQGSNTTQIFLILLIVLSGIGFISTMAIFIFNFYKEKKKILELITKHEIDHHQIEIIK